MEQTIGKRIVFHRKRLGLTQDALAEKMGVTAQAVSKWENNQSCPDIGALPKLAEIFGISTDELLGIEKKEMSPAPVVPEKADEGSGIVFQDGSWEVKWDGGKKSGIGFAVWIILVGCIMLASYLLDFHAGLWDVLWPSALLVFGVFGLLPRFSFFRLGCSLFGLYFLMSNLNFAPFSLRKEFLLPVFLLLFGGSLLVDTIRKPNSKAFSINRGGKNDSKKSHCHCVDDCFDCATAFGENHYAILLDKLAKGTASVSFGEMYVDLQKCTQLAPDCSIDLSCSFGELELIVPRRFQVELANEASFASVEVSGAPVDDPSGTIRANCRASFGEISIRYV